MHSQAVKLLAMEREYCPSAIPTLASRMPLLTQATGPRTSQVLPEEKLTTSHNISVETILLTDTAPTIMFW
ncbi:hypothetical protein N7475_000300 [Penicillium sp. IBT 31633x]|nr:hypothetical protein N7475_000300 [Penicillium sp. IBT 31633x]